MCIPCEIRQACANMKFSCFLRARHTHPGRRKNPAPSALLAAAIHLERLHAGLLRAAGPQPKLRHVAVRQPNYYQITGQSLKKINSQQPTRPRCGTWCCLAFFSLIFRRYGQSASPTAVPTEITLRREKRSKRERGASRQRWASTGFTFSFWLACAHTHGTAHTHLQLFALNQSGTQYPS